MKKKLIAIVASLAMVATMVPASAFATGATTTKLDMSEAEAEVAKARDIEVEFTGNADTINFWKETNENVSGTFSKGTLSLTGCVPYRTNTAFDANITSDQQGNYIAINFKNLPRPATDTDTIAMLNGARQKGAGEDTNIYQGRKLKTWTTVGDAAQYQHGATVITTLRLEKGKTATPAIAFLNKTATETEGVAPFAWTNGVYFSTSEIAKMPIADQAGAKKLTDLEKALKDSAQVAGMKTFTIDTSALTLLTKAETQAMDGFIAAVKRIDETQDGVSSGTGNPVNIDENDKVSPIYKQATTAARAIYDGLDSTLKKAIEDAVAASATTTLKTAYKALATAEANIKSYDTLTGVAALVAALPAADKLDLNDAAAVKQVKDVYADVEALAPGAKNILLATSDNDYLTSNQVSNYYAVTAKVNDSAVKAVVDAIDKLPTLPVTAFVDKAAIDAAYAPMVAAEKAFDELTKEQQEDVTNESDLTKYRADYDKLIKAFVDPIYQKAAAIDLKNALTAEDVALITELKGYVEGEYIATKNIAKFDQATYDALIAALGNEYDLSEATVTVNDADALVYDGTKKTPAVTVTDKVGKEIATDNYTVIYSDNRDAGEATVTVAAKGATYTGSAAATFTIKPAALTADMVKVANATYTGKALKPAVSVASGVDYTVAYKNNTAVGKASAVVTGTGNYTGTITKNFIVKPAKESITSLKAGKKQITVAYKAQTGAKYRVICKASGLKAIGTNTTATKKTVKKLKSGKTYQVKVRAYKAVDGKTYYGTYSAVKKVKVK